MTRGPFRSLLFAPGNHPRKAEKVFGAGADAAILDLEDAVPLAEKPATRAAVEEGISQAAVDSVRCPIGLDIGADSPEEIAVAVCAEIMALEKRD